MNLKNMLKKSIVSALVLAIVISSTPAIPHVLAAPATPKNAIYLLPGFMGSRLFSQRVPGMEIWTGLGLVTEIGTTMLGKQPEFANNANGTGMLAYADRKRDTTGTLASFSPLISSIKNCLKAGGLSDTYAVEFFSYNWLADLNNTAKELAADINAKGYEKVILISHSNGGLLMSTFISQSAANKGKVLKAILIAPPLWGTYTALEPIETGGITLFDGSLLTGILGFAYDVFINPISKGWVKAWAKNSPNVYQLMPSEEYISRVPILYRTTTGTQLINTTPNYYALLNKSPNVNPTLVNGNDRSMRYLREAVFGNDILNKLSGLDVTVIGCEYGFITPTSVVYRQSGTKAIYDGPIFTKAGDGIVAGMSMKGDGRYKFVNLPGANHIPILSDSRALTAVNDIILGKPVSSSSATITENQTSSLIPSVGMSDMIRVELKSSDPLSATVLNSGVKVVIYDIKGKIVSQAQGESQMGFINNSFAYTSWSTSEDSTNIICYIPKSGYTMEVFTGNTNRLGSAITVCIETLDASGAILTNDRYKLTGAALLSGSVFTLDCSKSLTPVTPKLGGATLSSIAKLVFKQNWKFTTNKHTLKKKGSFTPAVSGVDAALVKPANYNWTSSDESVAVVSAAGVVTAKAEGTAVITAIAKDDSLKMESIEVTVVE